MKFLLLLSFFFSGLAQAELSVITTTSNLADLVKQIGGDRVKVESLCRGVQDPHFLEAKPSYTFKLSKTDLLVSVGGGLEGGWLPLVIRGSRNPKLRVGQSRHLVAAAFVELLEQNPETISRSQGDVHPEGNPHFMLSPTKSVEVAKGISDKLLELDSKNSDFYQKNLKTYSETMDRKFMEWRKRIPRNLKVITYHKTLTYFYEDFGITNVDVLEPKPGIPPSASHVLKLISTMKKLKIKKIIVENYFDSSVAKRIKREIPDVKIEVVPVGVGGEEGVNSLFDLYDHLIAKIGS